jgi:hypothetical protein
VSSEVHGTEWLSGTLRAWHLAMLRYAVTLDNADRLAVLRIALEIDGLDPQQDGSSEFEFFRRTSAELCAAILQPNEGAPAVLQQYLDRLDDDRLKRAFAAAIDAGQPAVPLKRAARQRHELWKGLSSRSTH